MKEQNIQTLLTGGGLGHPADCFLTTIGLTGTNNTAKTSLTQNGLRHQSDFSLTEIGFMRATVKPP